MSSKMLLEYASIAELTLCIVILAVLLGKRLVREFPWVTAFMAARAVEIVITGSILFFRKDLGIPLLSAYLIYFYAYWCGFVLESLFTILILHAVYKTAMKPLQGLSRVGTVIFRWVAVACVLVTVSMMIAPQMSLSSVPAMAQRLQQGLNVLTLCLLVFVCFSTRLLGLTYRSRMFGVILGLGIIATSSLVEAAWFFTSSAKSLYSPVYAFTACAYLAAALVWGFYFAMPEPKRGMVLLPTTSPYFLWNRVSEALGDAPGQVAIAGFTPDMLTPTELTALTASSRFARENQQRRDQAEREREQTAAREAMNSASPFPSIAMQG